MRPGPTISRSARRSVVCAMSSQLASPAFRHGHATTWRAMHDAFVRRRPPPLRMRRYLPLATLTTALAVVLPAFVVSLVVPRGGPLLIAASALATVALSIAITTAAAALWQRQRRSRDVVF